MIFRAHRIRARLRKADRLRDAGQYEEAQSLYVGILNSLPGDPHVLLAYAGLAETEYRLGSVANARYYAGLFVGQLEFDPGPGRDTDLESRRERLAGFLATGELPPQS